MTRAEKASEDFNLNNIGEVLAFINGYDTAEYDTIRKAIDILDKCYIGSYREETIAKFKELMAEQL